MMKTIFFIDLDNTIYFTAPNVNQLLGGLYAFLEEQDLGVSAKQLEQAKKDMLHTPFQRVAARYGFKAAAVEKVVAFLQQGEVTEPLSVHREYHYIKALKGRKFVVTAGFTKKQRSKLAMLGIAADFEALYVVDVSVKEETKKDAFETLIGEYGLDRSQILVIGDDADSEIRAGLELGLETFLFDPEGRFPDARSTYRSSSFESLAEAAGQAKG
ncbi:hypothetical protein C7T94_03660 [Pedobacter yulinensis]|uniref:HAD family hydrolase n=1 Tax=Pedobacter yulinensis TaxID=2126353 RepID=A0A2T3HRY4_9SPHI|nr:HAD family hydrolase [Pedobacter yulinensis]PST85212.1 hypothetical protein C7T94_03660 [Pedobacter yulinensis]